MKTDKFNRMIEKFECDFSLIKEGKRKFSSLDIKMKDFRYSLSEDMELMQELSTMLRYGQAEIHLIKKPMTNADRIRNMTDEELAEFLVYTQSTIKECMIGVADCKHENTDKDCKDCFLEWLQAEVEEGE
jgi:hypothetical protein